MSISRPLFARPIKRLAASCVDIVVVGACGWFVVNMATRRWYPYDVLAWALPLSYIVYECICLRTLNGGSLGRRLFDIQVVSAIGNHALAWWQIVSRPSVRVALYGLLFLYAHPAPVHFVDVAVIPFVVESCLLFSPSSLTLADFISRTRVINTAPPQPHRAPAAPMYSGTDAEFGYPPRKRKTPSEP
jgi:uncharacterized RDD family membrane protein YckC